MKALMRFFRKEIAEILRTWRVWVVGGVLLFFAVLSPIAAKATPALVSSLTGGQDGVKIVIPDPTYLDSYAQWIKNLAQMGMMLVIFASAGLIANERASGTASLVVSKPVSRGAFAVAKYLGQALLITVATVLGTAVVWLGTQLVFGEAPAERLLTSSAAWLMLALVAVALTEVFSAVFPTIAAAILALTVWALTGIASLWKPLVDYSPIGLLGAPSSLLADKNPDLLWPVATGIITIVLFVALASVLFGRKEL